VALDIKLRRNPDLYYPEDVLLIQRKLLDMGIDVTPTQAGELWAEYSGDLCASWLVVSDGEYGTWAGFEDFIERYIVEGG